MKKTIALILAMVMLLGVLTGCGNSGSAEPATEAPAAPAADAAQPAATEAASAEPVIDEEATLVIPVTSDIATLNMLQNCLTDNGLTLLGGVYDHLILLNQDGSVDYRLAENVEVSEDGTVYTMKIREGVTWHDGEAVTADDVVFTWRSLIDGKIDVGVSAGMYVDGVAVEVEKLDDYTVQFTCPRPSNGYMSALGLMYIIPEHIFANVEDMNTCDENQLGIGYGPYKVVEHIPGERLLVERYDDYYGDKPHYKYVEYRIMPDYTAQEVAFLNGEIDYFMVQDAETLAKYEADPDYNVYTFTEGRVNYMQINQNSPIFEDARAREAICLALNFDEIVMGAYGSEKLAKPATGTVICAGEAYYNEDLPNYQQDTAKAAELAKESGLDQLTLRLTYNTGRANMENVALIIQQQLAAAGITAEVIGQDSSTHLGQLFFSEEGWDIGLNGWASDGKANYCSWYIKGSYYSLNTYTTDELNALWTAADMAQEGIEEKYNEVSKLLQTYFTYVPFSSTNKVVVTRTNTHGWDATDRGDLSDYTVLYKTK